MAQPFRKTVIRMGPPRPRAYSHHDRR